MSQHVASSGDSDDISTVPAAAVVLTSGAATALNGPSADPESTKPPGPSLALSLPVWDLVPPAQFVKRRR